MSKSPSLPRDKKLLSLGLLLSIIGGLFLVLDFQFSFEGGETVATIVDILPDIIGSLLILIGAILFVSAKSKITSTFKVFSWLLLASTIISFLFNALKFFKYEGMNDVVKLFSINESLLLVLFAILGMGIAKSYAKKMVGYWKFFIVLFSIPLVITLVLNLMEFTTKDGEPIKDVTFYSGSFPAPLFLVITLLIALLYLWTVLKTKKLIKKG